MPDVATSRTRRVTISGGGAFGYDSQDVFLPMWSIGGPPEYSRQGWNCLSEVSFWNAAVWVEATLDPGYLSSPGLAVPRVTLTIHRGGYSKSATFAGTPYNFAGYAEPAQSALQYFDASQGTWSFSEVVDCRQHVRPDPYEARSPVSFTCSASINCRFVDRLSGGGGTTVQTISASLTMTDADISGFHAFTYADYGYFFAFSGCGVSFDTWAQIGFDSPGLISQYSGINTHYGKPQLTGGGSEVTFHWDGSPSDINRSWGAGGSGFPVPAAQISFYPSWAMAIQSNVKHYGDGTEVGATLQHWYGTDLVGEFASGSSYRYPGSGLIDWVNLDSFFSGAVRDGTGFQTGSPVPSDPNFNPALVVTGSNYGLVGLLLQKPGDPIHQPTYIRFKPSWADGYGTYINSYHPIPNGTALRSKLLVPYRQGTIAVAAVHRFTLFEQAGVATALSADPGYFDTYFSVVSAAGFAAGDTIVVGSLAAGDEGVYTVTGVSPGQLSIAPETVAYSYYRAGEPVVKSGSRWGNDGPANVFGGADPVDPAPQLALVSGSGIDGNAMQVTTQGFASISTLLRYVLKHQAYRYARLQVRYNPPATTLTSDVAAGATDLPVTSVYGFNAGNAIEIDHGTPEAETVVVQAAAPGHLTVSALAHPHPSGATVARTGSGRVLFVLTGSLAGPYGWLVDLTTTQAGTWLTQELDLLRPGWFANGGNPWTTTSDFVPPRRYLPVLQPDGILGASISVLCLDSGQYQFDYLEGHSNETGNRTPRLLLPHLWGQGDAKDLSFDQDVRVLEAYEPPLDERINPDYFVQVFRGVTNGVEGWVWMIDVGDHQTIFSDTQLWNFFIASLDNNAVAPPVAGETFPNDTGITIVLGTAGDPDPLMVFLSEGEYASAFQGGTAAPGNPIYGMKPAAGAAQEIQGRLRSGIIAYYGAGDLYSTSDAYDPVVTFHVDWILDGEALLQTGGTGAHVTLAQNPDGGTVDSSVTDDDGMARLTARYGVVLPYDNVSDSPQFTFIEPPYTQLTAPALPGDTVIQVADSSIAAVGDYIAFGGFGGGGTPNVQVTAVAAGQFTISPAIPSPGGGVASGTRVTKLLRDDQTLVYTPQGRLMNAYWLRGDLTPTDASGYWSEPGSNGLLTRKPIVILDRYQSCYFPLASTAGAGWLLIDDLGNLHVADVNAGGIRYRRSDFELPLTPDEATATGEPRWAATAQVTPGPGDSEPRFAIWHDRRIPLVFTRSGAGVMWTETDSDGDTFLKEVMLFPGASRPTINVGREGELFVAAFAGGQIQGMFQDTGDDDLSAPFTFVDENGTPLNVADDSFHFAPGADESRSWELIVRIQTDSASSLWQSFDYPPRTWFRKA